MNSYDFDDQKMRVNIVVTGPFTMESMINTIDLIADDQRFRSDYCVIVDLQNAEYKAMINDGDEFVAALKRRQNDFTGKIALVVSEDLHFLGRLYTVLASISGIDRMQCFTDINKAHKWCDLPMKSS